MEQTLSFLSILSLFTIASVAFNPGQVVAIPAGFSIQGQPSSWQPEVSEYLGIPYAQPPLDDLRWEAPKKYLPNNAVGTNQNLIKATAFSVDCPANVPAYNAKVKLTSSTGTTLAALGQYGDSFGEDCLTLNVWTKPQVGEAKKAVLVWIYGGGFALGNSANPVYNGARLASDQDVVVVSMNYRLGMFGFPGGPGLKEQNLGLLDQRMAVEWVRDNIAAFGGDPSRITLFGQSAGGISVDLYSYAWTKDPIVNGFIPQSGTWELGRGISMLADMTANWYAGSQKLGCGGKEKGEATVACMKSKSWKDVLRAVRNSGAAVAFGNMGDFGPVVDERIVFSDYEARSKEGRFIKRPILVGNTVNEMSLFMVAAGLTSPSLLDSFISHAGNSLFDCPSSNAALVRRDFNISAWRYRYNGQWPNQELAPSAGAFHASELSLVFGTTQFVGRYYANLAKEQYMGNDTAAETQTMQLLMKAWTTFAKDPETGLSKVFNWPLYDPKANTVIAIGDFNKASVEFVPISQTDTYCGIYPTIFAGVDNGGLSKIAKMLGGISGKGSLFGYFLPSVEVNAQVQRALLGVSQALERRFVSSI